MNRLAALIETLSLADLRLIQKDLEAGNIERLLARRILELDATKTCPTCGQELSRADQKFSIEFGPAGLRQKAYFDELDCLDYFVEKLHTQQSASAASRPNPSAGAGGTFDD